MVQQLPFGKFMENVGQYTNFASKGPTFSSEKNYEIESHLQKFLETQIKLSLYFCKKQVFGGLLCSLLHCMQMD